MAKVSVPSVFGVALSGECPNVYYQVPCNHVFCDSRCGIVKAAVSAVTEVVNVAPLAFNVLDDGFADGLLKAGEATVTRTGERRLILNNVANTVAIGFPFVDLIEGDEVTLTRGCDHSFTTCDVQYANAARFGGDPYIPPDNPFEGTVA